MKMNAKSVATVLFLLALASGCAGGVKTRIAGTGPGLRSPAVLAFLPTDEDSPKRDATTEVILRAALMRAGYSMTENAAYLVDYSVAERSAGTGISSAAGGSWLSQARAKKPFWSCKEKTHRFTLTIIARATGETLYKGSAEEHHCRATFAESRSALIAAIIADLPQPQSKRELRRQGRN